MGIRRQAREWALQFLFQRDYHREEIGPALQEFWEDKNPPASLLSYAEELIYGVESRLAELDAIIGRYARNWDVKRMGGVDRNLMRIALYEMTVRTDVPPIVSIDEAVEIAKAYSSNESGRFVNGILDHAFRDLHRDGRTVGEPQKREST